MKCRRRIRYTAEQRAEIWDRWQRGESMNSIGRVFAEAMERIVAGSQKKSRLLNPSERERIAYHEMGHALVAASLPGSDPVHKVSIIPRSIGALGSHQQLGIGSWRQSALRRVLRY